MLYLHGNISVTLLLCVPQVSMAMDLHLQDDCPVTLRVRDQSRPPTFSQAAPRLHTRSETARRHQLTRQRPVQDETTVAVISVSPLDIRTQATEGAYWQK